MWVFILATQLLAFSSSLILWWFVRPKRSAHKVLLVALVFIISNAFLFYGLSDFWRERFRIYLVFSILQGFMIYAAVIMASIGVVYGKLLKRRPMPKLTRLIALLVYIAIVSVAVMNSYSTKVQYLTVTIDKPMVKPLTMAVVSDTHLGKWFGNRQLDKLAGLIDESGSDVVLLAGDIMDDSLEAYDQSNMKAHLSKLKAPLGVYAVLGNHDYLGHERAIEQAVTAAGIKVLNNDAVLLDDSVWLIGRADDLDHQRLSAKRLVEEVTEGQRGDKPIVFMDHRPSQIDEISQLPVDLHVSGHTHGGQMFPLTTIMRWFQPLIHGHKRIHDTLFLVTSGYGFGSVPFRLGTRSEIWIVTLEPGS